MPKKVQPFSGGTAIAPTINREKARPNGKVDVVLHCGIPMHQQDGGEFKGDCPLCGRENKFYMNPTTGQWDCKVCGESGNIRTFIRKFYEQGCVDDDDRLKSLSELRGIRAEFLRSEIGVKWNPIAKEYVVPTRNSEGEVSNLLHWRNYNGKRQFTGLPTVNRGILGYDDLMKIMHGNHPTLKADDAELRIWCGEGPWDKAAMRQALADSYPTSHEKHVLLFTTGSGGIPDDCIQAFNGKKLRVVNDNDDAGMGQTKRVAHRMAMDRVVPSEALFLEWPKGLKTGYDINDLVREKGSVPAMKLMAGKGSCMKKLKIEINADEVPGFDPNVTPMKCESFQDLMHVMRNGLSMFKPFSQSLLFVTSVGFTLHMGDIPIWTWLTGPAGSGKTTLAEIIAGVYPLTYRADKFTGFFSGYSKGGKDHSLLKQCNKRILIIPDFTGMLSNSADTTRVMGELRNISEGQARVGYRNDVKTNYSELYFPMIACVTPVIRTMTQADMGERFLICEIDREWIGSKTIVHDNSRRQMKSIGRSMIEKLIERPLEVASKYTEQKCHMWGFYNFLRQYWTAEKRGDAIAEFGVLDDPFIENLAIISAVARSIVDRERDGTLKYRPRAEVPNRLYAQLLKTAISMYLVLRPSYSKEDCITLVKHVTFKLAMDTALGWPLEVMLNIGRGAMTVEQLKGAMGMSHTRTHKFVTDLIDLGVLEVNKLASNNRGPKEHAYSLRQEFADCMTVVLRDIATDCPEL